MTTRLYYFALTALLIAGSGSLKAQGLLSLKNRGDFKDPAPVTYSAGMGVGYDTLNYKSSQAGDIDSAFLQGSLGATFHHKDQISPWNLGLDFGSIYYLDDTNRSSSTDYSARVVFDVAHAISERLKLVDNFYLTYEVEPNFGIGASTASRNGQYFYGYNNFAVSYAWSERFSTTSSYTVDGIKYEDSDIGDAEDRMSHLLSQQFSWAWTKTLKLVGEYRFRTVSYRRADSDFTSHFVLAGVDKAWSERTTGSFRGGAEFYSSKRTDKTAPYAEVSINHATSEKSSVQLFASAGFDGSELGSYDSRYSYRVGANGNYQVTKRLSLNSGLNYAYSVFDGSGSNADVHEHELSANAGLGYRLWDNVTMDANYSYTILASDDNQRDYDRNRISLGINASF